MNRKRDRSPSLSHSAATDRSTKLCLVCEAMTLDDEISSHYVFVWDPTQEFATDGDGFIQNMEPTLRIDDLDEVTFSVFKSTLYIFESEVLPPTDLFRQSVAGDFYERPNLDRSQFMKMIAEMPLRKSVYSFDLSQLDLSSKMLRLHKSELHKLPDMIGAKVVADSFVTPNGKILVFSKLISSEVSFMPNLVPFELYDPDSRVWIKLPNIDFSHLVINGAGFLSGFRFFISTYDGNFVLDLDKNENCWNKYELLAGNVANFDLVGVVGAGNVANFDLVGVVGEEGEVCLTDSDLKKARDWTTLPHSFYLPLLSRFPDEVLFSRFCDISTAIFGVVDSVDGEGCFSFCVAKSLLFRGCDTFRVAKPPFFILDVIRSSPSPSPRLELTNSIKFCSQFGDLCELSLCRVFGVKFTC